jgi:signal transduction histidine kinase
MADMADSSLHFEVHPSVVYQLGESLISDATQAIIELVKNSYDADASYSKVVIDTQGVTKQQDYYYFKEPGGIISIEDDGFGMDLTDLKNGWLIISNRKKREIKCEKKTTPNGRTPLGDKGLGRLGVQKLGKNLEIFTRKNDGKSKAYHLGFSWLDFRTSEKLENVEIKLSATKYPETNGTKIVISGLMEPELWQEKKQPKQNTVAERLKKELSRMISPYKEIRDFTVYIEIDNKSIDLIEISSSIRSNALMRYELSFNGRNLMVSGKTRLDYFLPQKRDDLGIFQRIVKNDNGAQFYNFLKDQKYAYAFNLQRAKSKKWFVDFSFTRSLSELDKVEYIDVKKPANPGPFKGEIDYFNFKDDNQHIFDQKGEYKNVIKELSGIRIYRDGFAIRVDKDWLKLGEQQTTGGSFYGLRPMNTLGFIALTARENMELEETTDREGFKDTIYYRNFYLLMQQFVKFSANIQENLRRSWLEFRDKYKETLADIDSKTTIEDMTQSLKKRLSEVLDYQKGIDTFKERILANKSRSEKIVKELETADKISSVLQEKAIDILSQFKPLLDEANIMLDRLAEYLNELNSLKELPAVIDNRIGNLRRQMDMMYESVALGLTAEALSHEINNVIDQLSRRSKAAKVALDKKNITDSTILLFIEYVKSAVISLQKQMSFLSPTLRYVREERHIIIIEEFINELIEYYRDRMTSSSISMKVSENDNSLFQVKINKGKLIQIIDNLVLNSEYWLKEDIRQGKIKKGLIEVNIVPPYIQIYDNGRGIDPGVENSLFEPFVSTKAEGTGRGLGLFIVKQLLDSEGCNIELLSDRNKKRHLFKFQIDLGGILYE